MALSLRCALPGWAARSPPSLPARPRARRAATHAEAAGPSSSSPATSSTAPPENGAAFAAAFAAAQAPTAAPAPSRAPPKPPDYARHRDAVMAQFPAGACTPSDTSST